MNIFTDAKELGFEDTNENTTYDFLDCNDQWVTPEEINIEDNFLTNYFEDESVSNMWDEFKLDPME